MPDDPELAEIAEHTTQLHADNQRLAAEQDRTFGGGGDLP
jgi:hypothetical protein